jgi:micrococcal nuclease
MVDYQFWYNAFVKDVYDGDSITVDIDLGFNIKLENIKLRLSDIDTPEIRGKEKNKGFISRDWLKEKVLNKWVSIKTEKDITGKYGRYLAYVYLDDVNLNEQMIKEGLAKKYNKK